MSETMLHQTPIPNCLSFPLDDDDAILIFARRYAFSIAF